jgi:GAF domain-containing protein
VQEAGDTVGRRIAELAQLLLAEENLETTLRRVADLSVETVPGCDATGVSLAHDGQVTTSVASGDLALRVDSHQYTTGEGPCLAAIDDGQTHQIDSMADDTRWPRFAAQAQREGVVAVLSVPLPVRNETVGALNMYAEHRPFDESSQRLGERFARQAAVALTNAETFERTRDLVEQLNQALESRDVIGQAKGILMAREGLDADDAFEALRSASQQRNKKLRDIAREIVAAAETDAAD